MWEDIFGFAGYSPVAKTELFDQFLRTRHERILTVTKFLTSQGLVFKNHRLDWKQFGAWLVEAIRDPNCRDAIAYSAASISFSVDIGTLLGEEIRSLSPDLEWKYYIGKKKEIGANSIILSLPEPFSGVSPLTDLRASALRIFNLKFNLGSAFLGSDPPSELEIHQRFDEERLGFYEFVSKFESGVLPLRIAPVLHNERDDSPGNSTIHTSEEFGGVLYHEVSRDVPNFYLRGVSATRKGGEELWTLGILLEELLTDSDFEYEFQEECLEKMIARIGEEHVEREDDSWLLTGDFDIDLLLKDLFPIIDAFAERYLAVFDKSDT